MNFGMSEMSTTCLSWYSPKPGRRPVNGLCPYRSSRGLRPFGSFMYLTQLYGVMSPDVKVFPPITVFERLTALSAP